MDQNFFSELTRRNAYKVAVGYAGQHPRFQQL
jgi:hypothetical protein